LKGETAMKRTQEFSSLGQQLQADNEIIAHIDGMAIVKNEWGNLFFFEVPEEYCEIGDVVESHYLSPIEELDPELKSRVLKALGGEE
jgi:hypothetical protein